MWLKFFNAEGKQSHLLHFSQLPVVELWCRTLEAQTDHKSVSARGFQYAFGDTKGIASLNLSTTKAVKGNISKTTVCFVL